MSLTLPYPVPGNLAEWAADVEAAGGYPTSDTPALIAWGQAEGGSFNNPDYGNVLGTTLPEPGSAGTNSAGVQNYAASGQTQVQAWQEGLTATISMLNQSNMKDINAALQSGNPAELPPALNADPWGTSGSSVASILGENPDTIAALGAAGGSGSGALASGGGGVQVQQASIASALGGSLGSFLGISSGEHVLVRMGFAIVGLILLIIGFKELFSNNGAIDTVINVPKQGYQTAKSGVKRGAEAGAAVAAG